MLFEYFEVDNEVHLTFYLRNKHTHILFAFLILFMH
jgi:hypothetical protein